MAYLMMLFKKIIQLKNESLHIVHCKMKEDIYDDNLITEFEDGEE
jgi:hypothetical protein